ncbi:hypothetical protein [Nonomuraea sp. 10N515B]|uniref:hypothetical protein n=1 Tax=Nonomuraea sp. 10N515B TaxID=3457422 RepID=UPI003FCCA30F
MDRAGEVRVSGFCPVVGEAIPIVVGEIIGGSVGEKRLGEVEAHPETAGIHRGFQQSPDGRGAVLVAAQQFGGASEVLGNAPLGASAGKGTRQQAVTVLGKPCGSSECIMVEGVGDSHCAAGEQLPGAAVRVGTAGSGDGGVLILVLGLEGSQDEDRSAARIGDEGMQGGGDALACLGVAKVVLGFVEPHHRVRRNTFEVGERCFGPCRVVWMPQKPPLRGKRLDSLPARSGLARGRRTDQDQHPAAAIYDFAYRIG